MAFILGWLKPGLLGELMYHLIIGTVVLGIPFDDFGTQVPLGVTDLSVIECQYVERVLNHDLQIQRYRSYIESEQYVTTAV
jgi:hypothetical protein